MINKGVLDRIEEGEHAVILVESLDREFVIKIHELPVGSKVGTWFDVNVEEGEIVQLSINVEETKSLQEEITDKMDKLRGKSRGSRFKRN